MSTWLLACLCCWAGCVTLAAGHGAAAGASPGPSAGTPVCVTNFILRIDCRWVGMGPAPGPDAWLLFTNNQAPGAGHRCVFQAGACVLQLPQEEVLVPSDSFHITLHQNKSGREKVSLVDPQFLARKHVKLDPPSNVRSNVSSGCCILTWGVSQVLQPLSSLFSYELAFKRQEEAWEQARHKDHILGVAWLALEAIELEPGATYEARLRVQMAPPEPDDGEEEEEEHYQGQWSEWSRPARFLAPLRPGRPSRGRPDSVLVTVSTLLLLTSLAYLLFKLSPRVKRSLYQNVPSPAAFFQPLYSRHGGDFQTWAGGARLRPQNRDSTGPGVLEAIASLTYQPAHPRRPARPQEGGTVLLEGPPDGAEPPPAYLPQEDWAPAGPAGPEPLASGGGSGSDYCTLSCCGAENPVATLGCTGGAGPVLEAASHRPEDQQVSSREAPAWGPEAALEEPQALCSPEPSAALTPAGVSGAGPPGLDPGKWPPRGHTPPPVFPAAPGPEGIEPEGRLQGLGGDKAEEVTCKRWGAACLPWMQRQRPTGCADPRPSGDSGHGAPSRSPRSPPSALGLCTQAAPTGTGRGSGSAPQSPRRPAHPAQGPGRGPHDPSGPGAQERGASGPDAVAAPGPGAGNGS